MSELKLNNYLRHQKYGQSENIMAGNNGAQMYNFRLLTTSYLSCETIRVQNSSRLPAAAGTLTTLAGNFSPKK